MRNFYVLVVLVFVSGYAQVDKNKSGRQKQLPKASIDMYRIIHHQDTSFVDTSLTIHGDYKFNYLRRDYFGLLPLPNEGQPYNTLQYSLQQFAVMPHSGRKAKHFKYIGAEQINYFSVATPLTELYFKSVMEQGQNLDAFVTLNISPGLNLSVAYNGLRSLGKYINQLSSTGNFRLTTSYTSTNKKYSANFHIVAQDILNGENGGLTSLTDFTSGDPAFNNRARLEVYNRDAQSFLEGKRLYLDHHYYLARNDKSSLYISHLFNHEYKFFEYRQATIPSTVTNNDGTSFSVFRFGDAFVSSDLRDRSRYNHLNNKVGVHFKDKQWGNFALFAEEFRYNYFFDRNLILDDQLIPGLLNETLTSLGGQYLCSGQQWQASGTYFQGIGRAFTDADFRVKWQVDPTAHLHLQGRYLSKLPDLTYRLHQSRFVAYNWVNNFQNEVIRSLALTAKTKWVELEAAYFSFSNKVYFSDDAIGREQLITPKQVAKAISYYYLKASKEFSWHKWSLDNTILYQETAQETAIINIPQVTQRHSLYYSDYFFKKALYLQTGVTVNMFSAYYMDNYNPVVGDFFVQTEAKYGDFPVVDLFINGRIQQTRIFIKAEHINSLFTQNNYFSTPDLPYRDFTLRVGLVWNFFQ